MFTLDPNPKFTHPITVQKPTDGGHDAQTFRATYRVIGDERLAGFDLNDRASSTDFLRTVLVGFEDVQGGDGQPVPYSDSTRDALIDLPFVRVPLVKGYFAAVYKAALGN